MSVAIAIPAHGADVHLGETARDLTRLRTFHTLDALRGVAALAVVLYHASYVYGLRGSAEGQIAVDLFFVMSGFIIAYRYDADLARGLGVRRFAAIRLIRLYPLFLLGTLLGFLPALVAVLAGAADGLHRGLVESLPLALLMLPSRFALPRIDELYPLNVVAWSLALEIVVNVVYAATYRLWTVRRLAIVLGLAFAGLCACVLVYGRLNYGYAWERAPVGIARVVYGFTAGVLIFRVTSHRRIAIRAPWWLLVAAAIAVFVVVPPIGQGAWELVAIGVLVPVIVLAAIANEPPKALRPACALAGVFSYVVYSLHVPFIGLFQRAEALTHHDPLFHSPLAALAFTLILVALCIVAHLAYDKPVRRALTRRFIARGASRPAVGRLR